MKKIYLLTLFLVILLAPFTYTTETYVKAPIIASVVGKKTPTKRVIHKTRNYTPPKGDVARIADKVARETGVSVVTISRIMFYESGYNPKAVHINTNNTKDIGLLQINSIHKETAKKMGLDIENPEDNATYAIYLIQKNGLRDWKSSEKFWKI